MPKEATQFEKGKSGNPGGRPKGLARRIRERISEDDLIDFHYAVATMDDKLLEQLQISKSDVRLADRQTSVLWLTERGHGKAVPYAPIEEGDPLGLDDVDSEFKRLEDELAKKRETQAARLKTPGVVAGRSTNGATPT